MSYGGFRNLGRGGGGGGAGGGGIGGIGGGIGGGGASGGEPHNMMVDPSIANARIYVGNIPTNDMSKHDLEDRFEKYGNIMGIALNRGFGFVQFEQESSAMEAIKAEHGAMFRGSPMEVNVARVFGSGRARADSGPPGRRGGDTDDRDNFRERSPLDDRSRDRGDWRSDRFDSFAGRKDSGSYFRDGSDFKKEVPPFSSRGSTSDDRSSFGSSTFRGGLPDTRGLSDVRGMPDVRGPARDYPTAAPVVPPEAAMDRTNDCEIIVFNKAQREYAEYIERRLKQLGLSVDILFPNEDVPIGRILANISSRGTLYAIVVMPQNEEHRSLTLNILHGVPQEHRNMPIEDAVPLIKRNFDTYIRSEKSGIPGPVPVVPAAAAIDERHPDPMQALLTLLYENRPLTVLQYDRIIQYLQEKREMQVKIELGDAKDFGNPKDPAKQQQSELQHRIMNILNQQPGSGGPTPTPVAAPAGNWQQQNTSTPLLNDPNVQKALDSLMQGNLLRKIGNSPSSNSSQLGPPPSQQSMYGGWGSGNSRM